MSPQPDLVTGDAVVLDLRFARLASRGLAFALDVLIQAAILLVLLLVAVLTGVGDEALSAALALSVVVLVRVGYPVLFETLTGGRTPGKMALGLRVVREDGGPIRFRHALTRGLTGAVVDFGPVLIWSVVAVVVSLCSAKSKRVGDYLAGTVVVAERTPDTPTPMISMPPLLTTWASGLDLSGLPDDLALAARQYLARYSTLRPEARDALGYRLAQEVADRIGTPVGDVPPWMYLMAVLAERRNRLTGDPTHWAPGPFPPPR